MNKVYEFLSVTVLAIIGTLVVSCGGSSEKVDLNQVTHKPLTSKVVAPTAVDVYIDASGSMKGYIDGVQGTFKTNVPNLVTNMKNHNSLALLSDSIRCYTIDNTKLIKHDTDKFKMEISNSSIFNGKSTELHKMFKIVAEQTRKQEGHVGIIVSDCVLSFPSKDIHNNSEANVENIGILENYVTDAMTDLVNSGMSVAVVKYESDFNGRYYYTYHDKALKAASGQTMNKRPYYFIMMGAKENLDAIFNKEVLAKGYTDIYMYNTSCAQPKYTVVRGIKSGSISDVHENKPVVRVKNKRDTAYFYMAMEDFMVPSYMEKDLEGIMRKPQFKGSLIEKCEPVELGRVMHDCKIVPTDNGGKKKMQGVTCTYLYIVTLKSNAELINIADGITDVVYFPGKTMDAKSGSIDNDEIMDITELEGKTFMFDRLINGIEKAYIGIDSNLASVEVAIQKKN